MPTKEEKVQYLSKLAQVSQADERSRKRRDLRGKRAQQLLEQGLPSSERESLRQAMSFSVDRQDGKGEVKSMDERGQRHSIESEDATDQYKSIDAKDYAAVQKALERIMRIKQQMLAEKDEDGEPLFDEADLESELFSPLVREGVMPDNLVIDDHSQTAKLLKNTYKSYLGMLDESKKKKQEKDAETVLMRYGATGEGKDKLKAIAKRWQNFADDKVGALGRQTVFGKKLNLTTEQSKGLLKMGVSGAKVLARGNKLISTSMKLDQVLATGNKPVRSLPTEEKLAKQSGKVLVKGVTQGVPLGLQAYEVHKGKKVLKKTLRKAEIKRAAREAAERIDALLAQKLASACPPAKGALDGRFDDALKTSELADAVLESEQGEPALEAICKALGQALGGLLKAPPGAVQALQAAAQTMQQQLRASTAVAEFTRRLNDKENERMQVFDPFVDEVAKASQALADPALVQALQPAANGLKQEALEAGQRAERLKERKKVKDQEEPDEEEDPLLADEDDEPPTMAEVLTREAFGAAMAIDATVNDELLRVCPASLGALDGQLVEALDLKGMAEAAVVIPAEAEQVCTLIAEAFTKACRAVRLDDQSAAKTAFTQAAERFGKKLAEQVDAKAFNADCEKIGTGSDALFDQFVQAALPAATAAFDDKDFIEAMKGAGDRLNEAARKNNDDLITDLAEADEQIEAFERQLVLMDDNGKDMARQRSLSLLVAQLEKDREALELVSQVGAVFGGFGTGVVRLGTDSSNFDMGQVAGTVATEVAESMIPAMKAAKLVLDMAVNVIQIANRYKLAVKFKADVEKALKAGSPLLPAIQNFYSAKKMQQTFAGVELALQTVQLAGAICASVPEPITMGVGRLLTAIGKLGAAAQGLTEKAYTFAQLEKGWATTLDALNNPKNRRLGLDALHINGTLAVHAVAWAAMENDDPIAREILNSCGVNAQTLADSESDQDAVIDYLETRLHEDLQFKDRERINTDWVPKPLELSYPAWFVVLNRARTQAKPPLAQEAVDKIDAALRALDLQPKTDVISANMLEYTPQQLRSWLTEATLARSALAAYKPRTAEGDTHSDMVQVRDRLMDLAGVRMRALQQLLTERTKEPTAEVTN